MKIAHYITGTLVGSIVAAITYVVSSMLFIGAFGNNTERGVNGLQIISVVLSYPLFLAGAFLVTVILTKKYGIDHSSVPIIIVCALTALVIGVVEGLKVIV